MKRVRAVSIVACCMLIPARAESLGVARAADDARALMERMPADAYVAVVVRSLDDVDKVIAEISRRVAGQADSIADDFRTGAPFGQWTDTSKPMGMCMFEMDGQEDPVAWVVVQDFDAKIKELQEKAAAQPPAPAEGEGAAPGEGEGEGAAEEPEPPQFGAVEHDGMWELTIDGEKVFAKKAGDYVIFAGDAQYIAKATETTTSLAQEVREQVSLFDGRDIYVHVNLKAMRPMLLPQIAQGAAMAPMFAAMAAQGGDPAAMTAIITTIFDSAQKFVEQVRYVDVSVKLTPQAIDATIASGYDEGAIKTYLAAQKPAEAQPFTTIAAQPYFLATSFEVVGDQTALINYMVEKFFAAPAGADAAAQAAAEENRKLFAELYTNMRGANTSIAFTDAGMRMAGDYLTTDPARLVELMEKQVLAAKTQFMQQMGGGITYEVVGHTQIEGTEVVEFTIKVDETNPQLGPMAPMIQQVYGASTRFVIGKVGDRVRIGMGDEAYLKTVFAAQIATPLSGDQFVAAALGALPPKRNMVALIDLAGIAPLIGMFTAGAPDMSAIPPGPPIAISVSVAGEPARVDIHVPVRAIERVVQAFSQEPPA